MRTTEGLLRQIQFLGQGATAGWIDCPVSAIPPPGKHLLGWAYDEVEAPQATLLFAAQAGAEGFLAAPPLPPTWTPGTRLTLYGPLGRGFDLPAMARRLALAALGESMARLLPLVQAALARGAAVALYAEQPLPLLPAAVEVHPLKALPEALAWADYLALDLPLASIPSLRQRLGLKETDPLPRPAQALVRTEMPCGGLGECGVCALSTRRTWKLVCQDGPVFDLSELI